MQEVVEAYLSQIVLFKQFWKWHRKIEKVETPQITDTVLVKAVDLSCYDMRVSRKVGA